MSVRVLPCALSERLPGEGQQGGDREDSVQEAGRSHHELPPLQQARRQPSQEGWSAVPTTSPCSPNSLRLPPLCSRSHLTSRVQLRVNERGLERSIA